jgi:hypothetical protein
MAHVLCAFILILCLAVPAFASKKRSSQKKKPSPKKDYPTSENCLVNEMLRHVGVQYQSGGTSPGGLDCSGYVGLVYRNAYGMDLPHQSGSLFISSELQKVTTDEIQTGDLLFFTSSRKSKRINHVGIYLSEGRFVHAASGKGVTISGLDEQYWSERYAGARRVPDQSRRKEGYEPIAFSPLDSNVGTIFERDPRRDQSMVSQSLGLELGKGQPLHVSLFQDSLISSKATYGDEFLFSERMGLEGRPAPLSVQGVRLERDLRFLPWLVVTPSLSYFNYEGGLDDTGLPRRSVGVDLSLVSKEEGWRISTGFRYLSLIPSRGLSEDETAPQGFDMSLTYSKRVSETLSVSLIGERFQRSEMQRTDLPQQEKGFEDQRFSVLFSFSY